MRESIEFGRRRAVAVCAALALAAVGALGQAGYSGPAQNPAFAQNPTSAQNPFYGSVTLKPATDATLELSLDEAVRRGLKTNLGLQEAQVAEEAVRGEKNQALQEFLPTITVSGGTGIFQQNLVAVGFGASTVAGFGSVLGLRTASVSPVTKDDLTQGQVNFSESLFSGPVIAGWRAAGAAERAAYFQKMSARGEVVQQVATAYLRAVAAASELEDAIALEQGDQALFDLAHAAHEAGTVANLDELRARVQLQAQQQAVIAAGNARDKDLILLKREIGVAPGQKVQLTDATPFAELAAQTPEEVRAVAYKNRQDYQTLQNQLAELKQVHAAYRSERLPTLSFSGHWGTDTVNGAGTHGNFVAVGTLSVPIFNEAKLRGDEQAAAAQLDGVRAQLEDARGRIEQQVRAALLDVDATHKLVEVARSNQALATRELSDETDRVSAGVDDNLPLVDAQATLANAQNNVIESLYQYNLAKLALARAAGILEQQYRVYLGQ
ncbi:MAG TPA: TolC family protein [Terracidiphilus sp.]|nr:TolC family protein [Terracidiphilus sp.]